MVPVQSRVDENSIRRKNAAERAPCPQTRQRTKRCPNNRPDNDSGELGEKRQSARTDPSVPNERIGSALLTRTDFHKLRDTSSTQQIPPRRCPFDRVGRWDEVKRPATDFSSYLLMRKSKFEERDILALLPYVWLISSFDGKLLPFFCSRNGRSVDENSVT